MTSRHASEGGRRGIATWIVVAVVAVLVVAAGTVAYLLIVRGDDKAQVSCASQVELPVVSAPGPAAAITAAATAFNATGPVARSACVNATVTSLPGQQTESALIAGWQLAPGAAPGMWVADSEADLAAVESTNSGLTAGRDTSPMATSPVVLAVRTQDAAAVTAAGLSWQSLPAASGPNGTVTLPSGQHLVLALPNPAVNRGTSYALQSIIAGTTGAPVDGAAVNAATPALAALGDASPASTQPATTDEALIQLASGVSEFTAVPVVASDLVTFNATTPGLSGISPSGSTVGDAVYAVPLTAGWVTPTLEDATAVFLAYLRGPGGDQAFAEHGLVVADAPSATAPVSTSTDPTSAPALGPATLPDGGRDVAAALATAIGAPPAS